jgi:hypothetical protein
MCATDGKAAWYMSPEREFPHCLTNPPATRPASRPGVMLALLLVCFFPRAWAAYRGEVLWGDSLAYLQAAEALQRGDLQHAFDQFGLNIYPPILAWLQHVGPWEVAGRWFSVLMATAAVLPLWGWIRRQFDDRVAIGGCLCYALHGKFVAVSPLIIRDPTFWFLFALTLYLVWRAIVEIRLGLFLAAGAALTLAVHTRTEGWLLLVPLLGWTAGLFAAAAGRRARLLLGMALSLAVIPLAVTVANLTWLHEQPRWEIFRSQHVQIAIDWWHSRPPAPGGPAGRESPGDNLSRPGELPPPPSSRLMNWRVAERFIKGFTYVGSVLTLIGVLSCWRVFLRREHLTLMAMSLLLLVGIRIRYAQAGLDIRYFLPMVFVALPWMALGFWQLVDWTVTLTRPGDWHHLPRSGPEAGTVLAWSWRKWCLSPSAYRASVVCVLAVLAATASLADGNLAASRMMQRRAVMGRWLVAEFSADKSIVGNGGGMPLAAYYAQGRLLARLDLSMFDEQRLPPEIASGQADVVLLWRDEPDGRLGVDMAAARLAGWPYYTRAAAERLPAGCGEVLVFVGKGAGGN